MNIEKPQANLNIQPQSLRAGLYIVATPIGNLRDVTLRALDVLSSVDLIVCEDTRTSQKFLKAYGINKKCAPYHDHSDERQRAYILKAIEDGQSVALISDAGMPMISDPGYKLVRHCYEKGIYVTTLPGANAPLSALQLSGLPSDCFTFTGFLPPKSGARKTALGALKNRTETLVVFEGGSRVAASLEDMASIMGTERQAALVREITKMYEEARRGTLGELAAHYKQNGNPKGEIVIVVAPADDAVWDDDAVRDLLARALDEMKTKDAAKYVADKTGLLASDLYDLALEMKKK